eukprot:8483521-Pyramimonas_sp.AAC.1
MNWVQRNVGTRERRQPQLQLQTWVPSSRRWWPLGHCSSTVTRTRKSPAQAAPQCGNVPTRLLL